MKQNHICGEKFKTLRRSSCLIRRRYQFLSEGGAGIWMWATSPSGDWFDFLEIWFWRQPVINWFDFSQTCSDLDDGVDDDDIEELNDEAAGDAFRQILHRLRQSRLLRIIHNSNFHIRLIEHEYIGDKGCEGVQKVIPESDFFQRMWERDWAGSSSRSWQTLANLGGQLIMVLSLSKTSTLPNKIPP